MKPWERDWQSENQTSEKKPWERDWETPTTINASDYNGSIFIGQDGEDVKPFEKLNMFMDGFAKEEKKESKSFGERWQDFSKNLLTVKVAPRSKELSPMQKAMEKTWQEGFSKVDWGEVGKSLGRGSLEFVKNATSDNLRIFADWYKSAVDDLEDLTPNEKKAITRNAENINKLADLIDKKIDLGLESDFLKPDEEVFRGEFEENPSMTRAISTIGSGLPSIVAGGAIYKITKSSKLTTAILSEIDAQDIYFGAREKGKTSSESLQLLGIGTAGTYFLEKVGLDAIFGKKGSPFAKRVVESVLSEGITEGGQTIWQNAVKKYGYDDTQRLMQGVLEASIGGALTGGVATTFMGNVYASRDSMKEKGATDTELDLMQEAMATELAKHADTIEPMFESNIQKSLDSLNAVIDSNIDKAEVEKAKKISQELTNISDKYYDMLKGKMPEAQAKSTSELLRNMAYFGSKMTGMSPAEFEMNEFPKMKWAKRFKDIQLKTKYVAPKKVKTPSLLQFIRLNGGVIDEGGELKAMDASKQLIGLVNKNGTSLDYMGEKLWEAGYFRERPTVSEVLELIDDELRGQKHYPLGYIEEEKTGDIGELDSYLMNYADVSNEQLQSMPESEKMSLYQKTKEKQDFDLLNEDEQERYSMMRENGSTHDEAMFNIKGPVETFEDIPFQWEDVAEENARLDDIYPAYEGETITINGQEKTVYNSNGDRIAKSKEALENFYKWFGDSKVVDEQGRPLVVYHGTNAEFSVFDITKVGESTRNKGIFGYGFYSSNKEKIASSYRRTKGDLLPEGQGYIMPLYYKLENPFMWFQGGRFKEAKESIEIAKKLGFPKERIQDDGDGFIRLLPLTKDEQIEKFTQSLKDNGYDGVIFKYSGTDLFEYVAFDANQIKSTSNRGTYSESENIYYQSAFAGSRVDYDRPSLEAIGSGEGNQAHGWGLYYALDRDVAEGYRERSYSQHKWAGVQSLDQEFGELKVNGKPFLDVYNVDISRDLMETLLYKPYGFIEEELENRIKGWQNRLEDKNYPFKDYAKEKIEAYSKLKNDLYENGVSLIKQDQGQVHEVDIPENPYLLDEQKSYREQSDYVREALTKIDNELQNAKRKEKIFDKREDAIDFYDSKIDEFEEKANGYQRFYPESFVTDDGKFGVRYADDYTIYAPLIGEDLGITGEGIYSAIARRLGSQKEASLLLEKYGIKGITYYGRQDGRCFVIFNPEDVKVIQKFYQGEQSPLGAFYDDTVYLFEKADASTIPHEMAHFWKKELRSFDNPQAKALLEAADKWETAEFERLYKVIKRDNGYAVANKDGSIVYDKRGQGFATEQDAISYAKEELFARGFERFLAEGKAPNKSMKQVFRNFLMWLHKKLKDAVSLNLNLSPDIKQVYAEILGGQDIDAFLNSEPDTFIENRVKLSQERESFIDSEIEKAVATRSEKVKDKSGKGFSDLWANAMIPLSTRLERVSRKLRNKQRRYESDLALSLNKKYAQAKPFLDIWKNMEENDIVAFDLALKNDYVKKQLEIVDKYNARKEWEAVRKLLEDTFDEAINAGLDIGYRPDYFPRKVKDVQGFLDYMRGSKNWTRFEEALRDADPDNLFTAEEQAEFINKYLRGFVKVDLMPNKYGSEKERTIDIIDNELNKYYAPSIESLVSYIEGLNARIQASKFLGRDAENLEESIGGYLAYLLDNNIISPKQVDEVREVLQARFGAKGVSNRFLRTGRDLSYIYTMGGINSAITQIDDLSVSIYKAGVWNTITAAFEAKKITRADLGLDNISAEFVDGSKTAKAVNKVFKLTGLDKIDAFAKNTLLNALMKKYQKMYKTDKAQLKALLEPVMEEETAQTMEDINNGELSDNVRYLLFSELSDVQPVSLSELPAFYNRGGNLRVLYMLKSFAIKRIDTYRNACFDKIRSKDWETRKEGVQNLFRLAAAMMVLGSAKDKIIDLLYGRNVDFTETMINNLLGLVGISKFQVYQARDKGLTSTVKDLIFPPLYSVIDDMIGDIWNVSQGKRELKDMETLKGIPLVGRFYYWWVGRGKEKGKGRKKKY